MNQVAFTHALSDLLRDYYRRSDYAEVILPLLAIRRLNGFDFEAASRLSPAEAAQRLEHYIAGCPDRPVLDLLNFGPHLRRLAGCGSLLPLLLEKFSRVAVGDTEASLIFEEVIRQFMTPERGEFFTPPELVELMVALLLDGREGGPYSLYDPTCGVGGMLFTADCGRFTLYGQELDPATAAIAKVGMRLRGHDPAHIKVGNTLAVDRWASRRFDFVIANPPLGVSWKGVEKAVKADPRFSAGLPRLNDSTMLLLQHCLHKVADRGRVAVITNGSPLFTGSAGSGESNIRRWIIENDWLEALIALPGQLFYNTGVTTYIWLLTRQKAPARRGLIQLINAGELYEPLRRSVGEKRKKLKVADTLALYRGFEAGANCKILPGSGFRYTRVKTYHPARGHDAESIPLGEDVAEYMAREVFPHAPGTVVVGDPAIGYEINFNRLFYTYAPLRSLADITADLLALEAEIRQGLAGLFGECDEPRND